LAGRTLLYEETSKRIYKTDREDQVLQEFTDNALTGKEEKRSRVKNKGVLHNTIASHIFELLEGYNIPTHFLQKVDDREMLVRNLESIPAEVVLRNVASGSFCERYNIQDGTVLKFPIMDFFLKDDSVDDRLVSESFMSAMGHATPDEMRHVCRLAAKINAVLKDYFERRGIQLVDFRIEFGRSQNQVFLSNEISPDTCTLWAIEEGDRPNRDRFLLSTGGAENVYRELHDIIMSA
jgi:phosphoribosylaminoimidazole-succinocarboxamide synthase